MKTRVRQSGEKAGAACVGNEAKVAWLGQYRINDCEIARLEEELMRWRSLAEKTTRMIRGTPGGKSEEDAMQRAVERIEGLEAEMAVTLRRRVRLRRAIERAVAAVPDERWSAVLRRRFIDGQSQEVCAEEMCYGVTTIRGYYQRGLEALELPEVWRKKA